MVWRPQNCQGHLRKDHIPEEPKQTRQLNVTWGRGGNPEQKETNIS